MAGGTALLRSIAKIALPVLLFLLVVIAWEGIVDVFGIKNFIFPSPLAVAKAAWENGPQLRVGMAFTASSALCGFLASLVVGTLTAVAFSQSPWVRLSLYPYAIFLQTVPIMAIAPLIILWFGTGFHSVVMVTFIISLFPIITNVTAGLLAVDPDLVDLFRLNNATRWQILWKLRLPNCVPSLLVGAKTSSGLAVVGSIVGEFFAGYSEKWFGLGYLIPAWKDAFRTDQVFAAILASTLLGLAIFATVNAISAAVLSRWYDLPRERG
jgi:NitT/TauT family transport system permease protein